jgi:hypothetical protein
MSKSLAPAGDDSVHSSVILQVLSDLRSAALFDFIGECNAQHAMLAEAGATAELYQERHNAAATALAICLRPGTTAVHPLSIQFELAFHELKLDIERDVLDRVLLSIPPSEHGNERLRAMDYAITLLVQHDRTLSNDQPPSKGASRAAKQPRADVRSPRQMVRLLDALLPEQRLKPLLRFSTPAIAKPLSGPGKKARKEALALPLGSFSDLSTRLKPCHLAACLLTYVVAEYAELALLRGFAGEWNGLTQEQRNKLAAAYDELARHLSTRLRASVAGGVEVNDAYPWFRDATRIQLADMFVMLRWWRPGKTPTAIKATFEQRKEPENEIAESKRKPRSPRIRMESSEVFERLYDDILFLPRHVGPPKKRKVTACETSRNELIERLMLQYGLSRWTD